MQTEVDNDPDQDNEVRPISPFELSTLALIVIVFWAGVFCAAASCWWVCLKLFR